MTSLALGFAFGWVGSMPIAGAVSIFVLQRGLAGRLRDGFLVSAGASAAEAIWCAVVLFGAGHAVDRWPTVGIAAGAFGGVVLMALGIYFLRLKNPVPAWDPATTRIPALRELRLGFTLVFGNVAVPFNWLALSAIAFSLGLDIFAGVPALFVLGVAVGIMSWFTILLLLLDRIRTNLARNTLSAIMKIMGTLLIATGTVVMIRVWFGQVAG